jgi:hypothetical protein
VASRLARSASGGPWTGKTEYGVEFAPESDLTHEHITTIRTLGELIERAAAR